ncbi:alpha/beta hydrolase [Clostridiaceae bacterium 68-1-5]|uniref:Alpha/beta hydrolase n=1 Tax=Suipraeoptans intestinalis TaxID=2606628 RepID=A0A6N7V3B2_9FIRM|nr:alpha/beta hydrolase [Suipraeoptans intestinalis]MSR93652.1 alpha/beta hydrolase [Suipraeoptans intestinalis]
MTKIFIHGLGQSVSAWDGIKEHIEGKAKYIDLIECDVESEDVYQALYNLICKECNDEAGKVDLCGLSLGGLLAMQYATEFPNKVRSLVLINSPYKVSNILLRLQQNIFRFMPSVLFKQGFSKTDSLKILDAIKKNNSIIVERIEASTLIIYGERDHANKKSAFELSKDIFNAKLVKIEKANHQINIEQPLKLAYAINLFWEEVGRLNGEIEHENDV